MKNLLTICMLLMLVFTGAAQDGTEPTPSDEPTGFMQVLSLIPDTSDVRLSEPIFSYADYHAGIEARGMDVPESLAGYLSGGEPDGPLFPALPPTGPSGIKSSLGNGGPTYPITVGFDFFQIAHTAEFGVPPVTGQVLIGDFNEFEIRTVYMLRGYTIERADETGTLLCPAAGCAEGTTMNIRERNPANPFGGEFGRSEPIFVGANVLLNSTDDALVEQMAAAYTDRIPSLADAPEFQALDNILAVYPYLSAVMAVNPLNLGQLDPFWIEREPEIAERLIASIEAAPLAPYQLAAFASAADEENEYGLALLVFVNADAAQAAAAIIDNRLAVMESGRTQQTYADLLNERGTLEPAQVVMDDATGLSVVVIRVTGNQPTSEEVDGQIVWSHRMFQRFVDMIYTRDTSWLVWGGTE